MRVPVQVYVPEPVRVPVQVWVLQAQRVWASALPVPGLPGSPLERQEPGLRARPEQGLQALPG